MLSFSQTFKDNRPNYRSRFQLEQEVGLLLYYIHLDFVCVFATQQCEVEVEEWDLLENDHVKFAG